MDTLDSNVKKKLSARNIKGLAKILQDEADQSDNRIWASAYGALKVLADELPFSNLDMHDIVKGIAERSVYLMCGIFNIPYKGKKHNKEKIKKMTQSILDNCEPFRSGRLPQDLWNNDAMEIIVNFLKR